MRNLLTATTALLLVFSAAAPAADQCASNLENSIAFYRDDVARREQIIALTAPIRSEGALKSYLADLPKNSPLIYFSAEARTKFLDSLTFGPDGLSGFKYSPIEDELTPTQAYELLSLFGVQRTVSSLSGLRKESSLDEMIMQRSSLLDEDYKDYRCEIRATCSRSLTDICTSNC
jgi:hypothetical protein